MDNIQKDEQNMQQNIYHAIAQSFGFDDLSDTQQQSVVEKMTESVIKRVLVNVYEVLNEVERKDLEDMMADPETVDMDKIEEFMRSHVSDYDAIVAGAIADLKKHITENTNKS